MPEFIPGITLCERFYWEAVRPILDAAFPGLPHSAALIGPGSEVLGFDTARSTDHHWGPRVILFLSQTDHPRLADPLDQALRQRLPVRFLGYATNFSSPDPNDSGVRHAVELETGPVNHMIEICTVSDFASRQLGVDPLGQLTAIDWLLFEEQRLLTLTTGRVFFDGLGQLEAMRRKLAYYPRDVWIYLLAAEWQKISQEEAFPGRTVEVGDELGSRLVTARIAHSLMRLAFMMERQYAPYSKWFGTAFSRLACASRLAPALEGALAAPGWPEREAFLCQAYGISAELHNDLGLTPPVSTRASLYFGRPFRVIHADQIANQLREAVQDDEVRRLPPHVGSVSQFLAAVDVLDNISLCRKLGSIYS